MFQGLRWVLNMWYLIAFYVNIRYSIFVSRKQIWASKIVVGLLVQCYITGKFHLRFLLKKKLYTGFLIWFCITVSSESVLLILEYISPHSLSLSYTQTRFLPLSLLPPPLFPLLSFYILPIFNNFISTNSLLILP